MTTTWTENHSEDIRRLPEHMRESVVAYIENGRPLGDFLQAVFSNDLVEAFKRTDDINERAMKTWAGFLYVAAPSGCWHNKKAVGIWISHGGLSGDKR